MRKVFRRELCSACPAFVCASHAELFADDSEVARESDGGSERGRRCLAGIGVAQIAQPDEIGGAVITRSIGEFLGFSDWVLGPTQIDLAKIGSFRSECDWSLFGLVANLDGALGIHFRRERIDVHHGEKVGGFGDSVPASGQVTTASQPVVYIGATQGAVQYSGLAPGYPGLWQINVQIPDSASLKIIPGFPNGVF